MKKRSHISIYIATALLLILTACGSVRDFDIANAIFIFPVLGDYIRKLGAFKPYLFALGLLWWAATALSRLTIGAHYLTDVAIGGLVTIFAYTVVSVAGKIYLKRKGIKSME